MTTITVSRSLNADLARRGGLNIAAAAAFGLGISLVLAIVGIVVASDATVIIAGFLAVAAALTLAWRIGLADPLDD